MACKFQEKEEQRTREGRVLKALYFDNRLPSDPFEPDVVPKAGEAPPPPRAIPQIDLTPNSGLSLTDFSAEGWPSTSSSHHPPSSAPPPPQQATNLKDLLSTLKPSLLQNIIGLTSGLSGAGGGHQLPSPPVMAPAPVRVPSPAAAGPPPEALPNGYGRPPPTNVPPPPPAGGRQQYVQPGGFPGGGPPYPGAGRGGMRPDWRPSFQRGGHHNQHHQPRGYRPYPSGGGRPCRFWLDYGSCQKEDRCTYSHVPR
jgi:hypothetical protein